MSVVAPVTPSVPVSEVAPALATVRPPPFTVAPPAVTVRPLLSVVAPLTPSVPVSEVALALATVRPLPMVAAPVVASVLLICVAPPMVVTPPIVSVPLTSPLPLRSRLSLMVVRPVTVRVLSTVVAPFKVAVPCTVSVLLRAVAPFTVSVPDSAVLPALLMRATTVPLEFWASNRFAVWLPAPRTMKPTSPAFRELTCKAASRSAGGVAPALTSSRPLAKSPKMRLLVALLAM